MWFAKGQKKTLHYVHIGLGEVMTVNLMNIYILHAVQVLALIIPNISSSSIIHMVVMTDANYDSHT